MTNLPNRYSYEHYILELQDGSHAIALLLFDVNYLKVTNDTFGHAAGDALLRSSAECILSCFGSSKEDNCFRFGGDEFAAVVKDTSSDEIKRMVERFREDQKKREISIACGCAYTDDIGETTFKTMMEQADREMYEQKKMLHVQRVFLTGRKMCALYKMKQTEQRRAVQVIRRDGLFLFRTSCRYFNQGVS